MMLQEGLNALHLACLYSREDTVKYLLAKGADGTAAATGMLGQTPAHMAAGRQSTQSVMVRPLKKTKMQ